MKKFILLYVYILFSSLSLASGIEKLNKFNHNNDDISGNFIQITTNAKNTRKSSGKFSILRPKYFKWEYNVPYAQLILADGENIWIYDKDLSQVVKSQQEKSLDSSPAGILYNSDNLHKNYTILDDNTINNNKNNDIEYVKAIPKNEDSTYKYIKIGIKNDIIYSMYLKDSFGNDIEIIFKNIAYNKKLNKNKFKFKIPKGVDVLDN